MRKVVIAGVGMVPFGKYLERNLKSLSKEAIDKALLDTGISKKYIEAGYVGNSVAGVITGQDTIRGQVILNSYGLGGIPVFNVENACASGSTAFHLGWLGVSSGMYDCVLILGAEKMTHPDRNQTFKAFRGGVDVEAMADEIRNEDTSKSVFMDIYAQFARNFMERTGLTKTHLAKAAVKNHYNGSLNPYAQYQQSRTFEEVLNDRLVSEPLTRMMCAPVSDGAAACILCTEEFLKKHSNKPPIFVEATVTKSTNVQKENDGLGVVALAAQTGYKMAGFGPEEIDLFEVHDTTIAAELMAYESLNLCPTGEIGNWIDQEYTTIHGHKPVNVSGGLITKGHPLGATGVGQIVELVWQLRGEAGKRQLEKQPKTALAQNAGGILGAENAACAITILKR
ncbi:thiolase family protein [Alkalihalobacterium elongatum]|uniref:thiolase family protein n=1 Tax=Alkalihalobacterium elongatum TaxID=2675466 RepID=UPI001C1F32D8|nr:thiolase family protein [Alkalihalobacterium elongatum]